MTAQPETSSDILIIGDAWPTLDHPRDSSIYLASFVSKNYGARVFWAEPGSVFLEGSEAWVCVSGEIVNSELIPEACESTEALNARPLSAFHSIHWRTDPPVELQTMRLWSWLSELSSRLPRIYNAPQALLSWNEKFSPLRYGDWAIPSLVSDSEIAWERFFKKAHAWNPAAKLIAKPSADAASRGVQVLPSDWREALPKLREIRKTSGPWVILQEFDPQVFEVGETRVFIVAGEVCSALCKRPNAKHAIMNLDAPENERPVVHICEPTPAQLFRAGRIVADLEREGVVLATIDFIGERILEINVTSAGLIRWIDERIPANHSLAARYWRRVMSSRKCQ